MLSELQQSLIAAARKACASPFGGAILVAPKDAAPFLIDGRANPPAVRDAGAGAAHDCAFYGAGDVLLRVFAGERALDSAYISGRLAISGDMSVLARLSFKKAP